MTPKIAAIINDQTAPVWLKLALLSAMRRDPLDAAADAEGLKDTLQGRHDAAEVLGDFAVSFWAKDYLRSALERPPADAIRDAETLTATLQEWCDAVLKKPNEMG